MPLHPYNTIKLKIYSEKTQNICLQTTADTIRAFSPDSTSVVAKKDVTASLEKATADEKKTAEGTETVWNIMIQGHEPSQVV